MPPRPTHSAIPFRRCRVYVVALAMLACCALDIPARAQDSLTKHLMQYQMETDPVHKAKLLSKLDLEELDAARKTLKDGNQKAALDLVQRMRDQVRETTTALNGLGVDPERHPSGFKDLQISLRECLRRFDDLVFDVPFDDRDKFRSVRNDLMDMQGSLMEVLFPPGNIRGKRTK